MSITTITERETTLSARVAELEAEINSRKQQKPLFWYRPCSDGGYERPIHDSAIEDIRKRGGHWKPLYLAAGAQPAPEINYFDAQHTAEEYGIDYNKFCAAYKAMLEAAKRRQP